MEIVFSPQKIAFAGDTSGPNPCLPGVAVKRHGIARNNVLW